jgi:arsenate reductase-like glutaredoxin family protein
MMMLAIVMLRIESKQSLIRGESRNRSKKWAKQSPANFNGNGGKMIKFLTTTDPAWKEAKDKLQDEICEKFKLIEKFLSKHNVSVQFFGIVAATLLADIIKQDLEIFSEAILNCQENKIENFTQENLKKLELFRELSQKLKSYVEETTKNILVNRIHDQQTEEI